MTPILTTRALNRTFLERQRLRRRERHDVVETVDHLVGMQSQVPTAPFAGLWTRIDGFETDALDRAMLDRQVVRTSLMRTTLHLMTARDALELRPLFQPVLERAFNSQRAFREGVEGIDLGELLEVGRSLLAQQPMGAAELGRHLAERWPARDTSTLVYAIRFQVPLVQVPPRGTWGSKMAPKVTTTDAWLGLPVPAEGDVAALLVRYLRAFGPASVADMRTWSWLTGLREVVDGLGPSLRRFRDERGRTLYDVPDAPILTGDEPAPVRFLPEYDNAVLSHDDRSRITDAAYRESILTRGAVLVDGFAVGAWHVRRARRRADLLIDLFEDIAVDDRAEVEAESDRLLRFLAPDAEERDIELARADPSSPRPRR